VVRREIILQIQIRKAASTSVWDEGTEMEENEMNTALIWIWVLFFSLTSTFFF